MLRPPPNTTLFPYTTLFRSRWARNTTLRPEYGPLVGEACVAQPPGAGVAHHGVEASPAAPFNTPVSEAPPAAGPVSVRSEEHTSELQSHVNLVCRLLLEKKK